MWLYSSPLEALVVVVITGTDRTVISYININSLVVDVVSMYVVITDVTSCNIAYQFIVLYYLMFGIICKST